MLPLDSNTGIIPPSHNEPDEVDLLTNLIFFISIMATAVHRSVPVATQCTNANQQAHPDQAPRTAKLVSSLFDWEQTKKTEIKN